MARSHEQEPLTKKEIMRKICLGMMITSVWLTVNGIFFWSVDQFRQRVKLVDDYGGDIFDILEVQQEGFVV
jgi:hypothetical protein